MDNSENPETFALDFSGEESGNGSMNTTAPSIDITQDPLAAIGAAFAPKRAVSYLRVSTREQAERGGREEGFSIPAQRDANKKKTQSLGAFIVKEFADKGESGTSMNRPALKAMIAYLKVTPDIDYVIVHKVDRLARNRADDVAISQLLDELGIRMISTSENIDQTPSGLLMHGIMSSIAEFYSANLATEVKKGMTEKVRNGGTIGRAPIGYLNTREIINGHEARTVTIDEKRAPLVRWAFEAYAMGEWTLKSLSAELRLRGLTSVPAGKLVEKPISLQTLHSILHNEFYVGRVKYKKATYPGNHEPLISQETFDVVQSILQTRVNGERTVKHPHYLKSTVYCGLCGSRLMVTNPTSHGVTYEYFTCLGRHSKRVPHCPFKSTFTYQIEDEILRLYERIHLSSNFRQDLERRLIDQLATLRAESRQEMEDVSTKKTVIERQRKKLLEAHYNDAIPLDILRTEQERLTKELTQVDKRLAALKADRADQERLVREALELAEHCADAYQQAPEHLKRMFNQIFFQKIYIIPNDYTGAITAEATYQHPFDIILGRTATTRQSLPLQPSAGEVTSSDTATQQEDPAILNDPRQRAHDTKARSLISQAPGLSVITMVGVAGFEPTASSSRTKRATKLRHTPCDRSSIAAGGRATKTSGVAAVQDPSQRRSTDTPAERWGSCRTVGVYGFTSVRSPPFGGDVGRPLADAALGASPGQG